MAVQAANEPGTASERPPVVAPPPPRRERLGLAEWAVGLGLLFGSLTGPWVTIGLPAGLAFVLHDRRLAVRAAAFALLAVCVLLTLASPGGPALLALAVGAIGAGAAWVASGRSGAADALAVPTLAGAGAGWALAALAVPDAVRAWEAMLGRAVGEGAAAALDRYRGLGMDDEALATMAGMFASVGEWVVDVWPALAALGLWLGVWLGGRLLARWGRIASGVERGLTGRPWSAFAVGEPMIWALLLGLVGLWVPALRREAANVALVAIVLFGLDGLAVAWWWLERRGVSTLLRVVLSLVALAFALPLAAAAAVALGLADLWLQFRDRSRRARSPGRANHV